MLDNNDVRKSNKLFSEQNLKALQPMVKVLKEISGEIGKSIVQISINWLISHDGVVPIPGAKNRDQAIINLQSSGWRLTQDQMKRIDDAYKQVIEYLDVF
jgi:Predicted oxidoreductases (related to aryl-alcohol dehydrogenases)